MTYLYEKIFVDELSIRKDYSGRLLFENIIHNFLYKTIITDEISIQKDQR